MSAKSDPARDELQRVIAEADDDARQASNQIMRSLCAGTGWNAELVRVCRDRLRRALADGACARRVLRDLDELDRQCSAGGRS